VYFILVKKGFSNIYNDIYIEITGVLSCLILVAAYVGHPMAKKCLSLAYKVGENQFDKGYDDFYFVGFWVVAFTFLRAATMKFVFHPIAKLFGIKPFAKRERFAEQGWTFTYYAVFWTWGMVKEIYKRCFIVETKQFNIDNYVS
jgi:acyl-CoA-dependent ceramide synthase